MQVITQICIEEEKQDLPEDPVSSQNEIFEKIKQAKQLLNEGVLTEEEFSEIKSKLISSL